MTLSNGFEVGAHSVLLGDSNGFLEILPGTCQIELIANTSLVTPENSPAITGMYLGVIGRREFWRIRLSVEMGQFLFCAMIEFRLSKH